MEIVIVGARGFGQVHLSAVRGMDISIVERDPGTIAYCTSNYDIRHVYSNLEEALRSDAEIIDLVVPHRLHSELSIKAMRGGKNVLLEKPISTSLEEANLMIRESRENRVKFMVAEQYFFDPSVRKAVELVREGRIGKPHTVIVRGQNFAGREGNFSPGKWRLSRDEMGGGALIDGGIHFIETFLNLGGDYRGIHGRSVNGGSSIEGEDTTHAIFSFRNGSTGLFYYSWAYSNPPSVPGFEIAGDCGSIYEDAGSPPAWGKLENGRRTMYGDPVLNGKRVEMQNLDVFEQEISGFAASVETGDDVPYPLENAVRNLRAVLDIYSM